MSQVDSHVVGYFLQYTPTAGAIDANVDPQFVLVSTDGAVITGCPHGDPTVSKASPPLAANVFHKLSMHTCTAVSGGNVYFGWFVKPGPGRGG